MRRPVGFGSDSFVRLRLGPAGDAILWVRIDRATNLTNQP